MEWLAGLMTIENAAALVALAALEVVLGIDNIVLLAILSEKLPERLRKRARRVGLLLAMVMRIALLLAIAWLMRLDETWFEVFGQGFSGKDCVLIAGGAFLVGKATTEIHGTIEGEGHEEAGERRARAAFGAVLVQIVLMDAVFSLDSVITAVGMAKRIEVMVAAIVIAVVAMVLFVERISAFVHRHPTTKMLALAFLMLVGVVLVADGLGQHVPRGYIYSAMAFSLFVEALNLRAKRRRSTESGRGRAPGHPL